MLRSPEYIVRGDGDFLRGMHAMYTACSHKREPLLTCEDAEIRHEMRISQVHYCIAITYTEVSMMGSRSARWGSGSSEGCGYSVSTSFCDINICLLSCGQARQGSSRYTNERDSTVEDSEGRSNRNVRERHGFSLEYAHRTLSLT